VTTVSSVCPPQCAGATIPSNKGSEKLKVAAQECRKAEPPEKEKKR
jgi:hypothetical protein